jgi:pSer/pThr/pTyr-binding forkhead associated (FHA) protein
VSTLPSPATAVTAPLHTPSSAKTATVVLQIAGRPGPAFLLDAARDNILGRAAESLVTLADRLASRNHAVIRFDEASAAWVLTDLGSRNGTWLDGVRVSRGTLADGSLIRVGTTELVFRPTMPADEPAVVGRTVVRRGSPAELEGAALKRASQLDEGRWPMLLYQAGLRLLAARSLPDIVGTTLELAAEFTAAASFAWLEPDREGRPTPICVVPPGSGLPTAVAEAAWEDARAGRAIWLATDDSLAGDVACAPLLQGGRVRAVLAAAGGIRELDFELLLSLASLAAAACDGREGRARRPAGNGPAGEPSTDALEDAVVGGEEDSHQEGTLALSASELELLRGGGGLSDSLAAAGTLRLEDWERLLAVEALRRTGGSVPEAAALMGISRATLYRRLDAYGLTRDAAPPPARS